MTPINKLLLAILVAVIVMKITFSYFWAITSFLATGVFLEMFE